LSFIKKNAVSLWSKVEVMFSKACEYAIRFVV